MTYFKDFDWGSSAYVFSFQFQESGGIQSSTYGGGNGLGDYSVGYYEEGGCRLAYISGTTKDFFLESFQPYFECPE